MKNLFLILIVLGLSIIVFLDDYVFVGPVVWGERAARLVVYSGIFCFLVLGIRILYGAVFASNSDSSPGSVIFLTIIAGIFIFNAFLVFRHREKVWSLI